MKLNCYIHPRRRARFVVVIPDQDGLIHKQTACAECAWQAIGVFTLFTIGGKGKTKPA